MQITNEKKSRDQCGYYYYIFSILIWMLLKFTFLVGRTSFKAFYIKKNENQKVINFTLLFLKLEY